MNAWQSGFFKQLACTRHAGVSNARQSGTMISIVKAALVCLGLACRDVFLIDQRSMWIREIHDYRSHCNRRNRILRQDF